MKLAQAIFEFKRNLSLYFFYYHFHAVWSKIRRQSSEHVSTMKLVAKSQVITRHNPKLIITAYMYHYHCITIETKPAFSYSGKNIFVLMEYRLGIAHIWCISRDKTMVSVAVSRGYDTCFAVKTCDGLYQLIKSMELD